MGLIVAYAYASREINPDIYLLHFANTVSVIFCWNLWKK